MDTFFLNELKSCCAEIGSDKENVSGISEVIAAYNRIIFFSDTARSEGVSALEEVCGRLNQNDAAQRFLFREVLRIVDGTEPSLVDEMGINMIAANGYCAYERLIVLMYYKAVILIQKGTSSAIVGEYMQSIMPDFIRDILQRKNVEKDAEKLKQKEEGDKDIRALCEDNRTIDERDYSIINQTALTLMDMSDNEMQRILRDTENSDIVTAMVELPGRARARIFDNISARLGKALADDVMHRGPVTFGEVEKSCVNIMRTVIKLEAAGEIAHHNLTVLKFVIGVYDMSDIRRR